MYGGAELTTTLLSVTAIILATTIQTFLPRAEACVALRPGDVSCSGCRSRCDAIPNCAVVERQVMAGSRAHCVEASCTDGALQGVRKNDGELTSPAGPPVCTTTGFWTDADGAQYGNMICVTGGGGGGGGGSTSVATTSTAASTTTTIPCGTMCSQEAPTMSADVDLSLMVMTNDGCMTATCDPSDDLKGAATMDGATTFVPGLTAMCLVNGMWSSQGQTFSNVYCAGGACATTCSIALPDGALPNDVPAMITPPAQLPCISIVCGADFTLFGILSTTGDLTQIDSDLVGCSLKFGTWVDFDSSNIYTAVLCRPN